ncbi:MAG: urea ABC transporter substrate-binding protein [Polyangiaceae bacterium]
MRVGILHSISGTMAICERHLVQAARLAIDEINSAGGVLGCRVVGITEDGRSSPETFAQKARKLLHTDHVSSIFGCWTSACRKAVRPIVEHANALLWYPVQYEGLERSRNVIYTGSCLNQQIAPATHWALGEGYRRFFLVGSDYVFPRTANYLIRAIIEAAGGMIVGEEYRPLGEGGFRPVVDQIRRTSPDLVFNTVNGSDNLELFRELTEVGLSSSDCPVMSFSLSELELAGLAGLASGHFACWSYFHSVDDPANQELIRRFRSRYGDNEVLSDPTVTAYAQVHLWKQVVETAGSFETDALLGAIVGRELSLGGDTLEVRSNNHVKRRALIGRIRPDNQFDVVWRTKEAIAPQPWLGVEDADLPGQGLVMDALKGLSDVVDRHASLERELSQRVSPLRRKDNKLVP